MMPLSWLMLFFVSVMMFMIIFSSFMMNSFPIIMKNNFFKKFPNMKKII